MKPERVTPHHEERPLTDWGEIRRRVESVREVLDPSAALSPDAKRSILKARASALAREPEGAAAAKDYLDILVFRLAAETYGIESAFVREVHPLKGFTPLPGVPPFVLGIVNVRGQILPVVDLKTFFNLPEKGLSELNKVIVIRNDRMEFGILADFILGVRPIPCVAIQAPPPTVIGIGAAYLRGVTKDRVIVIDADRVLCDEKIVVHHMVE